MLTAAMLLNIGKLTEKLADFIYKIKSTDILVLSHQVKRDKNKKKWSLQLRIYEFRFVSRRFSSSIVIKVVYENKKNKRRTFANFCFGARHLSGTTGFLTARIWKLTRTSLSKPEKRCSLTEI